MLAKKLLEAAGNATQPNYIEDVFSTYLYTGNGTSQNIVNGIDLSTKGGLVWCKDRTSAGSHYLFDTVRGVDKALQSDTTAAQLSVGGNGINPFNADGFTVNGNIRINVTSDNYASWTFRKQPKFFDVVTYTGNGGVQNIAHSLGSVPGCIIVKATSFAGTRWSVYHRAAGATPQNGRLALNTTDAYAEYPAVPSFIDLWNNTAPTSTQFTVGASIDTNNSGSTYVALLFAHNAGGFGLTGTDNVISCGTFTTDGSGNATVNLGYEPQFLLIKAVNAVSNWVLLDTMRGWPIQTGGTSKNTLYANDPGAENAIDGIGSYSPTATGFTFDTGAASRTNIYIAIRRGPMKVPTDATKVFAPVTVNNTTGTVNTTGFPIDLQLLRLRALANDTVAVDRLRGISTTTTQGERYLLTDTTDAEAAGTSVTRAWDNTGFQTATGYSGYSDIYWNFRRAPSFFDEVCYTGTGANLSVSHNLGTAPQLWIVKGRNGATDWMVGSSLLANTEYLFLNANLAKQIAGGSAMWNSTYPTASTLYLGTASSVNNSASNTYVAYLFATCAGVSKVGSYTGNGSTQTINCGFTGGARFVLIKRTDSTGDWYVYDTARGMTTLTDPYLLLNSTAAESATLGSVTTVSTGFAVNASILAAINTNGASYIYLAIA